MELQNDTFCFGAMHSTRVLNNKRNESSVSLTDWLIVATKQICEAIIKKLNTYWEIEVER